MGPFSVAMLVHQRLSIKNIGLSPCQVAVTIMIIPSLVGHPYKPSFATGILAGGTTQ